MINLTYDATMTQGLLPNFDKFDNLAWDCNVADEKIVRLRAK